MSLKVALANTRLQLGKAMKEMHETGIALTEAEEKKPESVAELQEKYDKQTVEVTRLFERAQKFEQDLARDEALSRVVNDPGLDPTDAHRRAGEGSDQNTAEAIRERNESVVAAHREAFSHYLRHGESDPRYIASRARLAERLQAVPAEERHALLGTSGPLGGFLVPEDFRNEVIKNLAGMTVWRLAGARSVPTSSSTLVYPSIAGGTDPYSTGVSGAWRAEGAQGTDGSAPATQDQPTFGHERIPVHVWQPNAIVITTELMEDTAVPLETIIAQTIAETKAMDEDAAFLTGDGVGRPRGVMDYVAAGTGPSISFVVSGDAALLKYDGLLDLFHTLPIQYRNRPTASFFMKSLTMSAVLKLKDSANNPILYANDLPGTLFGKKVFLSEFMPAVSGGTFPILFGDPSFYVIAERTDLRLQRLLERFAPNVGFLPTARLGGGVVRTQAFIAQKIST